MKERCYATFSLPTKNPPEGREYEVLGFCMRPIGHKGLHKEMRPTFRKRWVTIMWDTPGDDFCEECGEYWDEGHVCKDD